MLWIHPEEVPEGDRRGWFGAFDRFLLKLEAVVRTTRREEELSRLLRANDDPVFVDGEQADFDSAALLPWQRFVVPSNQADRSAPMVGYDFYATRVVYNGVVLPVPVVPHSSVGGIVQNLNRRIPNVSEWRFHDSNVVVIFRIPTQSPVVVSQVDPNVGSHAVVVLVNV